MKVFTRKQIRTKESGLREPIVKETVRVGLDFGLNIEETVSDTGKAISNGISYRGGR